MTTTLILAGVLITVVIGVLGEIKNHHHKH